MRIITEKDKQGLLHAFRVFIRAMSGERILQKAGDTMLDKALSGGISFDELLNKENWGRASEVVSGLTAKDYIDVLVERRIEVRPFTEEPGWDEPAGGFIVIAEAAHDFFLNVTGRGGKWNIPSALTNLAKTIQQYSLQALLSEALISQVEGKLPECTWFVYIEYILKDYKTLTIDTGLTEAQEQRKALDKDAVDAAVEVETTIETQEAAPSADEGPEEEVMPEDEPYPEVHDPNEEESLSGIETTFLMQYSPFDLKRNSLKLVLENYSLVEIQSIARTIEGGENLPLSEIIDHLTKGQFDPALEGPEGRNIHQNIAADLLPSFIDCVRIQGEEMDEELASHYDILKDSWDLRTPEVRKLHKLRQLIVSYGKDDPDLIAAIGDIESLYSSEE